MPINLLFPNRELDQPEKSNSTDASPNKEDSGAVSSLDPAHAWKSIDFQHAQTEVARLQARIAKAFKEGKRNKARCLQGILARSFYACVLAVRKVTSNKGSRTPGIDGQLWKSPTRRYREALALRKRGHKATPLRHQYILKKNGKQRALGIPCMKDRAMQPLHALTLESIAESTADWNSYGFRPFRGTADAIEHAFILLTRKVSAQWVLEGDIKACFDEIRHPWLLAHIPMDKTLLAQCLSVGYLEKGQLFPSEAGNPQGGIISNMTLDGLEQRIKSVVPIPKTKCILSVMPMISSSRRTNALY
jgi:RNA-directed DNA polymerase